MKEWVQNFRCMGMDQDTKAYKIMSLQHSEESSFFEVLHGLQSALIETCKIEPSYAIDEFLQAISTCLYYHGEQKAPETLSKNEKIYWI